MPLLQDGRRDVYGSEDNCWLQYINRLYSITHTVKCSNEGVVTNVVYSHPALKMK